VPSAIGWGLSCDATKAIRSEHGRVDLAVGNQISNSISVLINNSVGSFCGSA
jgi:hypothetical protein